MEKQTGQEDSKLDVQAVLKKAETKTEYTDVPLDEFSVPTYEEWKEACNLLLKGAPFDKKMYTKTYEGITFEPMYTRVMTEEILPKQSYPGMGDFLRGSRVNGYVKEPWGVAQACDETLPKDNNALLKFEIEKGSTVYNIRLDSATRLNQDAGEAAAIGDTGCNLTTLDDVSELLDGLDLKRHPLYMYCGASAVPVLSLTAAYLKACGRSPQELRGFIGANPLGELVAQGELYAPLKQLYDEMAQCARWATAQAPGLRTILIGSDVFSRGGANDVQEIAYTLAIGVEYIRQLMQRGFTIKAAASQIFFGYSMGANFFMQIAKLRAVRPLWAKIVAAFGGDEEDQRMFIHGRPALFFKTVYDPYVNMLRDTTEIFSGVVGGVDSYENAPFDESIRKGDVFSRRIARNVQLMLQGEFGMLQPIDPAGGSWAVESLTKQMQEKIWAEFQTIEDKGGIANALQQGYPQREIAAILEKRFKSLELRKDRIVGTNMYPNMTEKLLEKRAEDAADLKRQRLGAIDAYLNDLDEVHKQAALQALQAATGEETVAKAIQAAAAGATLAELRKAMPAQDALREKVERIAPHRWSGRYEQLRGRTETFKEKTGDNVKVFLANMGPIPQHKARAEFSTSFLEVGAFEVEQNNGFQTIDEAAAAAAASGADVVVICSTDKTYPEIVPELAPKLRKALPNATIYLAGAAPKELEPVYLAAGVDDFISVKANCYQILLALQKKKGMMN